MFAANNEMEKYFEMLSVCQPTKTGNCTQSFQSASKEYWIPEANYTMAFIATYWPVAFSILSTVIHFFMRAIS